MEAVNEPVHLMAIERELAGPGKEAALARYDAVLAGAMARLDAEMDAGMPPEEFQRAEPLKEAITLARKILRLTVQVDGRGQKA